MHGMVSMVEKLRTPESRGSFGLVTGLGGWLAEHLPCGETLIFSLHRQ